MKHIDPGTEHVTTHKNLSDLKKKKRKLNK